MKDMEDINIPVLTEAAFGKLYRGEDGLFEKYIRCQSVFPELSVLNALLVVMQRPDAEELKTKAEWQQMGKKIHDNEEPVIILEPSLEAKNTKDMAVKKEVYDISQVNMTFPAILRERVKPEILQEGLFSICSVPMEKNLKLGSPAMYDRKKEIVYLRLAASDPIDWLFGKTIAAVAEAFLYKKTLYSQDKTVQWMASVISAMLMMHYKLQSKDKEKVVMLDILVNQSEEVFRKTFVDMKKVFYKFYLAFERAKMDYENKTGQSPE